MNIPSTTTELLEALTDVQDYLVPVLDTYEQAMYWFVFRHTILEGKDTALISVRTANIGLGKSKAGSLPSEGVKKKKIRALEEKGCIQIVSKSHKGTEIRIFLPKEILGIVPLEIELMTDSNNIESIDFYEGRNYVDELLVREENKCFYTLQNITKENCVLDHVIPQAKGGNNSYKNIVASSFDANSLKNDKDADDFAREIYRMGLINFDEMQGLLKKIELLQSGDLVPDIVFSNSMQPNANVSIEKIIKK